MNSTAAYEGDRDIAGQSKAIAPNLKFQFAVLESEYLQHHAAQKAQLILYTFGIGFLLYFLLVVLEWPQLTLHLPQWALAGLVIAGLPNMLPPYIARFAPQRWRWLPLLTPMVIALDSLGHILAIIKAPSYGMHFPYALLTIQLTFLLLLSGALFRHAVPLAATMVVAYLLTARVSDVSGATLGEHSFVLGANFLLGSIACYLLERSERRSWLHARRVRELALRDQLTGLHNRRQLDEQGPQLLRQARREKKPVSALFADIDYFKLYNDALGHLAGDEALQRIAAVMPPVARRPLDIACRLGGEEFVLLLYDCDLEGAINRADELRRCVEALTIPHPKSPIGHVTLCVGVACTRNADISLKSLLNAADQALYQAKASGRNAVASFPSTSPIETVNLDLF